LAPHDGIAPDLANVRRAYAKALPGRVVSIEGEPGALGRLARERSGPIRYFSPVWVRIWPVGGETLVLDSRPSTLVRDYMRHRAEQGLAGALFILLALFLAIRQTTRPIARLSREIRRFGSALDAPNLIPSGSRELRGLAQAFNEMKARIAELVAERTRILAAIAHDMRTYLTRLRLRAEFIDDPEQRQKATLDLLEMSALLDDTLLFAGQMQRPVLPRRINLVAELSAIAALRREMGESVHFANEPFSGHSLAILADPLSLRRMLSNLIDNGLRYGTNVSLQANADERLVRISVTDDGPGVPDEALERLGKPYVRLDTSRDRASGGTGLGLAIVNALAAQNSGRLELTNNTPHGLRATLSFPAPRS
jgi:signal transduction histidine kinase